MKLDLEEQMVHATPQSSHILVFPFPVQGHMNPMVQFAKRLVSKGQRATIVTTFSSASKSLPTLDPTSFDSNLKLEFITDGSENVNDSETIDQSIDRFRIATTKSLTSLITKIKNDRDDACPLKCVVYHSGMPWVLDVARRHGIDGVPFFTTSLAVGTVFRHFHEGVLKLPLEENARAIMPAMPPMEVDDLPSFLSDVESYPAFLRIAMNQYSNLNKVNCIFFSSFDKLEKELIKWMESQDWPVKMIGPTIPSAFLDKRLEHDKDYGLSLFKPNVETCMKWLDSKKPTSVVYVSFGSLADLTLAQTEELAFGLKNSNFDFLWVVRDSEKAKLPKNFEEEVESEGKGLIVSWCPQLRVLTHKAVGCFVTHCGWNSTMEALSFGVPMVVLPHWADQPTNAKFVEDVWKVGVRVRVDEESGMARREEIGLRVKEVMDEEKGVRFRRASLVWKELANEAVDEGGSSDKNIEEFVAKLLLI